MRIFLAIVGIVFAVLLLLTLAVNFKSVIAFAKGSAKEMRRVKFPSWEQAISQTYIVLGSIVVFALVFGAIDILLVRGMGLVFR